MTPPGKHLRAALLGLTLGLGLGGLGLALHSLLAPNPGCAELVEEECTALAALSADLRRTQSLAGVACALVALGLGLLLRTGGAAAAPAAGVSSSTPAVPPIPQPTPSEPPHRSDT